MGDKLIFVSRHHPTMAQIEMAKELGYIGINSKKLIFPNTKAELKIMIDKENLFDNIIALAAPTWVHITFWERGCTTIEFMSHGGDIRSHPDYHGAYLCNGLWTYKPNAAGIVHAYFTPCRMSVEDQLRFARGR